jgi:hypothetical protein
VCVRLPVPTFLTCGALVSGTNVVELWLYLDHLSFNDQVAEGDGTWQDLQAGPLPAHKLCVIKLHVLS